MSFKNIGIELWAENKKGKKDLKQEPYFKVRQIIKIYNIHGL